MSSESIVVLVMIGIAIAGLVYLQIHSRRNSQNDKQSQTEDKD